MNFFNKISKSIYGPDLYSGLKQTTTWSAIKYYFKLIALVCIIPSLFWAFNVATNLEDILSPENVSEFISMYPADLKLTLNNGQFTTNVSEPYYIPIPEKYLGDQSKVERKIDNVVVIDTKKESVTTDILDQYKTALFITKNSIIYEKDGSINITPVSGYKEISYELNKQKIEGYADFLVPIIKVVLYASPFFIYAISLISCLLMLISYLILALLVWATLAIKGIKTDYGYAYRVTIHAGTLGLLVSTIVANVLNYNLGQILLWLIVIIIVAVNVKKEAVSSQTVVSN